MTCHGSAWSRVKNAFKFHFSKIIFCLIIWKDTFFKCINLFFCKIRIFSLALFFKQVHGNMAALTKCRLKCVCVYYPLLIYFFHSPGRVPYSNGSRPFSVGLRFPTNFCLDESVMGHTLRLFIFNLLLSIVLMNTSSSESKILCLEAKEALILI